MNAITLHARESGRGIILLICYVRLSVHRYYESEGSSCMVEKAFPATSKHPLTTMKPRRLMTVDIHIERSHRFTTLFCQVLARHHVHYCRDCLYQFDERLHNDLATVIRRMSATRTYTS